MTISPHTRTWIIDSGASEHITCDSVNLFNISTRSSEPGVRIPNGELVPVTAVGSLYLSNGFYLRRVLYVTQFQCNLLSASRLTKLPRGERVAMGATLDSDLWHRRLGHASNEKLQHISFLKGLQQCNSFCDPCLRAKQSRLPFPKST
ncbi:unnamed protein product, partial [Cuscuta epithymum]